MTPLKPYHHLKSISLLLLLAMNMYSCGQTDNSEKDRIGDKVQERPREHEPLKLNMPKDEEPSRFELAPLVPSTLSLVLLEDDKWYCYSGADMKSGKYYNPKQFRTQLLDNKKQWGDSLLVLIKPTAKTTYTKLVDALDEMANNKIQKYVIASLRQEEETYFKTNTLPDIEDLGVAGTEIRAETLAIRIDDNTYSYAIYDTPNPKFQLLINKEIEKTLEKLITDYRRKHPTTEIRIEVKENRKTEDVVLLMNVFKKVNESNYKFVNIPD